MNPDKPDAAAVVVIDQLTKLAARSGEPKTRLATRLFTEAVMGFKPGPKGPAARNGHVAGARR